MKSLQINQIGVSYNKRLTFIGKTGCGKTTLAWQFLRLFLGKVTELQIIFIDPKHELTRFGEGESLAEPKLVTKYEKDVRVQVFQTYYWNGELENMVNQVMERGKVIVVLNEVGGLATAQSIPDGMVRLYTQGRGKGVGAWAMLQYVKRYPKLIKSQSELFFIFRLTDMADRQDLLAYVPDRRVYETKLQKWYFWIYRDDWDEAQLFEPVKIKERMKPV